MRWQFYFGDFRQVIPNYLYLDVVTKPKNEYDLEAFKKDYLSSDYPAELYWQVRDIQIVP